jgi:hypothetical protein
MLKKYVYYTVGTTYKIPMKYVEATTAYFHDQIPKKENETDEEYLKRLYDDLSIEEWAEPSSTGIFNDNTMLTIKTEDNNDNDNCYDKSMNEFLEDFLNGEWDDEEDEEEENEEDE